MQTIQSLNWVSSISQKQGKDSNELNVQGHGKE